MTTASTTPEARTVTSEAVGSLRAVKLSDRIRYVHCDGENQQGGHGIMTFSSKTGEPLFVKEVQNKEDFSLNYNVFRMMEDLI
jgi:hypothetical protein